jgi:hypothetical protein
MTWVPFESENMIEVDMTTSVSDGKYSLQVKCLTSKVGDIARFCYFTASNVLWVASPADDDGIPVYPEVNSEGATRCDKINIVTDDQGLVESTSKGILADLDEYIRSKKALMDMIPAETYVISLNVSNSPI